MANGDFTIKLNNADAMRIKWVLSKLPKVERTPLVRNAFRRAMTPMVKQGKANIAARNSQGTGQLKKDIVKAAYPSKLYTKAGGKRGKGLHGNILHLVDGKQTKPRYGKKDGKYRGIMYKGKSSTRWGGKMYSPHGKPGAWTDAWQATKEKVAQILIDGLDKAVKSILNK